MAVVDGSKEVGIDGAEGCSVKILDKFAFGSVLEEDAICLVWVGRALLIDEWVGMALVGCSTGHWSDPASQ